MAFEFVLVLVLLCLAIAPLLRGGRFARHWRFGTTALFAAGLGYPAGVIWTAIRPARSPDEQVTYRPIEVPSDGYVGSDTCHACHPHEHDTWHSSWHRTMTQVATPGTVPEEFDNVELESKGTRFRLHRSGDALYADIGTPTSSVRRPIVLTTGSHHLQFCWFAQFQDSRTLGMVPFVYLKADRRWVPRWAALLKPENPLNDETGRWNFGCIACHTTHGRSRPHPPADGQEPTLENVNINADSRVAEFGIACEACHGPGGSHVAANRDPMRRYGLHLGAAADQSIINPARLSHRRSTDVCAQCHGKFVQRPEEFLAWTQNGSDYRPGRDLSKSEQLLLLEHDPDSSPPLIDEMASNSPEFWSSYFWPDGTIRVTGREFNGLVRTPCFQHGTMSCISCHSMHQSRDDIDQTREQWADDQLKPGMRGNRACVQCHDEFREERTVVAHTHHPAGTSGSNCYNCHMPHTTYGLLKAIRNHQVDSPMVVAGDRGGRPNACNQCHLDKTLEWTSQHLTKWYGADPVELSSDERSIAASVRSLLSGDAAQRAIMAWSYGWQPAREASGTDWMPPYLARLLEDPYAAVRYIAFRSLRESPEHSQLDYDYIGEPTHRSAASRRVFDIWEKRMSPGKHASQHRTGQELFIDANGRLMRSDFERLFSERDDRPIALHE